MGETGLVCKVAMAFALRAKEAPHVILHIRTNKERGLDLSCSSEAKVYTYSKSVTHIPSDCAREPISSGNPAILDHQGKVVLSTRDHTSGIPA